MVAVRAALWDEDGTIRLHDPGLGTWGYRVDPEGEGDAVPALTMSTIIDRYGIDIIDVLKIDIEGGEHRVFGSGVDWLGKVDSIAIELHERYQPGCERAFEEATSEFGRRATRGEDTFVAR